MALVLFSVYTGAASLFADAVDHLVCGLTLRIPLWPITNLYGCKIYHVDFPTVSVYFLGVGVALFIGLWIYSVVVRVDETDSVA